MPNANKYITDTNRIKKAENVETDGIFIGLGENNRESFYSVLGVGDGSVIIYDKVLYELNVNNISNVEPNAQTVTIPYESKRTHGDGVVDMLYINPSTKQVTANTSTANTKDTTVVINQALTLDGTTTGTGVTVTITQKKDYPTSISLSIAPKSTIPASGGSILSGLTNFTYSVKANHKSGNNNVDVTSLATITANVTGVTAPSKGVTASTETTAGNITFTATYSGLTSQVIVPIKQNENKVESYAAPTYTLSPGNTVLPASGGSVTGSISTPQQVRTWSSTATDTYSPTYTSAWAAQTISCNSRGTTTGGQTTLGTTQITVTANGKSTTKSYTVYQQANAVTNSDYNASNIDYWASCSIGDGLTAAGGSASVSASAGHTHKYYYLYTSTSTSGPYYTYPGDTVTTAMVGNGNNRFSYSNGTITHSSMGTTATTDTVTIRATNAANTSATGDASKSIVNEIVDANYSASSYVVTVLIGSGLTAGESSASITQSAYHKAYDLYTSGSYNNEHRVYDKSTIEIVTGSSDRFSLNNGVLYHSSMETTLGTDSATVKATNSANASATASTSTSVINEKWHTGDTASNYDVSISIGNGLTAAGGSAAVTASAWHTNTFTWVYSSGSKEENQTETINDTADITSSATPTSRFSYASGTITHTSMGTSVTSDTITMRVRNHSNTATTTTDTKTISNRVKSTIWGDVTGTPTGSCSDIPASGGTVTATTTSPQSLAQKYKYNYDSGSQDPDWSSQNVSCTVVFVNGTNTASTNSLASSATTSRTYITTLTIRARGNDNYTNDGSIKVYQAINSQYTSWGSINVDNATLSCGPISVTGGTATPTTGGTVRQYYKYYYDSGYEDASWSNTNVSAEVSYNPASISCSTSNIHSTSTVNCGDITATWTAHSKSASKTVTVYQNADSYSWQSSAGTISYTKVDTGTFPASGGSKRFDVGLTRTHIYKWTSDDVTFAETDNEGTATLSCTGGTLSQYSASNGDRITVTVGANTGNSRTITFKISCYDKESSNGWAQEAYKPAPSINNVNISFESYDPPTPTAATLTIINKMPYDTYGNWITSGPAISGDIHSGETRTYYWSSSSFPFTITGWGPGTVYGGSPNTWYIVNKTHSGSMTITYQGGYYQGTGSMTVYEGDELWLTT